MRLSFGRPAFISILAISLTIIGCDPEKETTQFLREQGFSLLVPAREYVQPGGLLISRGKGEISYLDAPDVLDHTSIAEVKVELPFDRSGSTALDLALGLVARIVRIPPGLNLEGSQKVNLDDVDIHSVRASESEVSATISKDATRKILLEQLSQGRKAFVVNEVVYIKSLTLKSASGQPLRLSYSSGAPLPMCNSYDAEVPSVKSQPSINSPVEVCRKNAEEITIKTNRPIAIAVRASQIATGNSGKLLLQQAVGSSSPTMGGLAVTRGGKPTEY